MANVMKQKQKKISGAPKKLKQPKQVSTMLIVVLLPLGTRQYTMHTNTTVLGCFLIH